MDFVNTLHIPVQGSALRLQRHFIYFFLLPLGSTACLEASNRILVSKRHTKPFSRHPIRCARMTSVAAFRAPLNGSCGVNRMSHGSQVAG